MNPTQIRPKQPTLKFTAKNNYVSGLSRDLDGINQAQMSSPTLPKIAPSKKISDLRLTSKRQFRAPKDPLAKAKI